MSVQLSQGIRLLSGELFDYNNPGACEVSLQDLASSLSKVCRFAGHIPYFYSVAQHSINASYIVRPEYAFDALMHDTAEAFTNDIPTPLKAAIPLFKELETQIETAMAERFGFVFPLHPDIKHADLQMLKWEKEYIKGDFSEWAVFDGYDLTDTIATSVDLSEWSINEAEVKFMQRYIELGGCVL